MHVTLEPAYGRDYTSREKAVGSWVAYQNWIITGPSLGVMAKHIGKLTNIRDSMLIANEGFQFVRLRFNKKHSFIDVDLKGENK